MSTTTEDGGATPVAEPDTSTAVTTEHNSDQVITTDDSGTPTMVPVTSKDEQPSADDAVSEDTSTSETQADDKSELKGWLDKKGLEINFENPNEVKLAEMQLNAEKKMHEATQPKPEVELPEEIPPTGNESMDEVINRQNMTELKLYVRDWFDANPDMKEHRQELLKITQERPWLQNMDDVKAHFMADPNRAAKLKQEGGREALTNLAQKQQAIPPSANATNSAVYQSSQITPQNVNEWVATHSQAEFEANYDAINKAMAG